MSSLSITCQSPPVRANSDEFQTFPLGMNALFAVTLHDNIGREFAVASIPLKYRLNRQVAKFKKIKPFIILPEDNILF